MPTTKKSNVSRRVFLKAAARMGLLTAGGGPFFVFPERAQASQKKLRILQWQHFIPGYDKWFSEVFARDWGHKYDTKVIVDRVPREKIRQRAAAEVAARVTSLAENSPIPLSAERPSRPRRSVGPRRRPEP